MNSQCGVQSKRKCESHESCVCIVGFSACECQKKSVMYETECRHVAVQRAKQDHTCIAMKHIQATLYLIRSEREASTFFFFQEIGRERERSCHNQFYQVSVLPGEGGGGGGGGGKEGGEVRGCRFSPS